MSNSDSVSKYGARPITCIECGKVVIKRGFARRFCSIRCSKMGARNPNWAGDKASVNSARERAKSMYGPVTGLCECGKPATDRHHVDGNTHNNSPGNLELLCRSCHMRKDGRTARLLEAGRISNIGRIQPKKTHCIRGHEFTDENTVLYAKAGLIYRGCRKCRNDKQRVSARIRRALERSLRSATQQTIRSNV